MRYYLISKNSLGTKCFQLIYGIALLIFTTQALAQLKTETLLWQDQPISVLLQLGKERRINFSGTVRLRVTENLQQMMRIQIVDENVYLLPHKTFPQQRLVASVATPEGGNEVVLLDLQAELEAPSHPIKIALSPTTDAHRSQATSLPYEVILSRYVAQLLYAPERLLPVNRHITQLPKPKVEPSLILFRTTGLGYQLLGSWQGYGYFVTALEIRNISLHPIWLDPRQVVGRWRTISFHHNQLKAAPHDEATTVAYLVSERPFEESVEKPWTW